MKLFILFLIGTICGLFCLGLLFLTYVVIRQPNGLPHAAVLFLIAILAFGASALNFYFWHDFRQEARQRKNKYF